MLDLVVAFLVFLVSLVIPEFLAFLEYPYRYQGSLLDWPAVSSPVLCLLQV
ncbi:hypothetical protein D3C71_2007200 [compost metagenome]